jgi:vanillate O-demethylase monooxygenase subunit
MKEPETPFIDLGLDAGAKQFRLMLTRAIEAETTS